MSNHLVQRVWYQVDRYFQRKLHGKDAVLDDILARSRTAGLPPDNVAPNKGKLLQILARLQGARHILEIGTLGGYSTVWLARALPLDGRLITLESDPICLAVATQSFSRAGLTDLVEIRSGEALTSLAHLSGEGRAPFDFIFIDADKQNNPEYLEWALTLSRPGTVIVAENIVQAGAVTDALSTEPRVQGVRRTLDKK